MEEALGRCQGLFPSLEALGQSLGAWGLPSRSLGAWGLLFHSLGALDQDPFHSLGAWDLPFHFHALDHSDPFHPRDHSSLFPAPLAVLFPSSLFLALGHSSCCCALDLPCHLLLAFDQQVHSATYLGPYLRHALLPYGDPALLFLAQTHYLLCHHQILVRRVDS